jgi:L-ascorbate metabolism protein UlaG (beta-lactamase superfamily)
MEIIWYGHACFRLKDRDITVITDPYDQSLGLALPRLTADIVTVSNPAPHHSYVEGVSGEFKVVNGPGEYEIGGTFITGIRMTPPKPGQESSRLENNVFVFYMDDLTICHLGDLTHVPSQSQVEEMGNIDILMIPVAGKNALSAAQAAEVISLIEPYIVIPMHYSVPGLNVTLDPVSKFLKEMGAATIDPISTLKINGSSLPEETQIVLLELKNQT